MAESKDKNEKDDWLPGHETMALEKEDAEIFFDAILIRRGPTRPCDAQWKSIGSVSFPVDQSAFRPRSSGDWDAQSIGFIDMANLNDVLDQDTSWPTLGDKLFSRGRYWAREAFTATDPSERTYHATK